MSLEPSYFDGCVILGQGKAGQALRHSLAAAGIRVSAVVSRSLTQNEAGDTPLFGDLATWAAQGFGEKPTVFVAWPDGRVAQAVATLLELGVPLKATVHLSGVCTPEVWGELSQRCAVGTFHPNAVLQEQKRIPKASAVGIEASDQALGDALNDLADRLSLAPAVSLEGVDRKAYHLAAVTVANLSLALVQHGITLWRSQGFSEEVAQSAMAGLLRSCADRLTEAPPHDVLTGPVARGDVATVENHLAFLKETAAQNGLQETYTLLSHQILGFTNHDEATKTALTQLIQGASVQSKK